jgi:hypothetical protein
MKRIAALAAALGLVLLSGVAAQASTSPAVIRSAVPAAAYCVGTNYGQIQVNNPALSLVAQWNSADNHFITPTSNHTIFCVINHATYNGNDYYEFQAVLNGHLSNDCMSTGNTSLHQSGFIGLNGCAAGQHNLLWAQFTGPNQLVNWQTDNCAYSDGAGYGFITLGTASNGVCSGDDSRHSDWYSLNQG